MRISLIKSIRYLLFLVTGILLLYLAFKGQDLSKMLSDLKKADYVWVLLSIVLSLLAHVLRAYRWNLMIGSLGHGTPGIMNTFHAVIMGYLANLAFPRMGELARCTVLNKSDNIPVIKLLGTVIAERIVDLLMLGIVFAMAILLEFNLISGFLYQHVHTKLSGRTGDIILLIFAFLLIVLIVIFFYFLMKKKRWGIYNRIIRFFSGMKTGILSVKNLDNKTGFILSSAFIWLLYGLSSYLCFFALNATSTLGPGAALSTLVFGSLAMIAPVQGGIGAFHWMVSEGLIIYGISKSDGLSYALLVHTTQTLIILFIGSISLILFLKQYTRKNQNEQTG
ncbi:MAG: lysylphosphatidylglycerol synthase transmembrane domain-containing protein [Daejeonella sp.]|uniref:lysylphosphatidylglycerol synthase transmembrane domain-containing protein n=1 Tax=Daejeonella sp. TaxID=2805397 RepID=UPI002736AD85|nr:lysylphosphatidylglycerol synthase transmembrane domain-containing protein [Daejeonella sp.]MDP3467589.1 lysylphosphatidylglycerol synthase transmembrane domain-containing protein [Daejeonella sp.]